MKKIITLLVALSMTTFLSAQSLDLRLQLQTDKTQYLVGEPVVLYLALENINLPDTPLPNYLEPEFGAVTFEISGPEGASSTYKGWNRTCVSDPYTNRNPGDTVYGVTRLFFDGKTWLFDTPGTYVIKATVLKNICTQELTIQVVSSADGQTEAALMEDTQAAKYLLFNGGDHLTEGIATLNQLEADAETGHRAYINLAFGQAYLEDFANFVVGELRRADIPLAISFLEKARDESAGLYTTVMAQTMLAEAYDAVGETQMAATERNDLARTVSEGYAQFQPWVDYLIAQRGARAAAKMKR